MPYKSAIIGLGNIGYKFGINNRSKHSLCHLDAYKKNSNFICVAGYDVNIEAREKFSLHTSLMSFSDIDDMLLESKPDIVSICSPNEFHFDHLKKVLDYKVPMIWLEKPAFQTIKQLEKIIQIRSDISPKTKILVNYQRRFSSQYIKIKELLNNKVYGNCESVLVNYSKGLLNNGSHMIDLIDYYFPNEKYSVLWFEKNKPNPDFIISINNQINVHFIGHQVDYHNIDIVFTFQKARVSLIHGGMQMNIEVVKENHIYEGFYRLYDSPKESYSFNKVDNSFDNALSDLQFSHENKKTTSSEICSSRFIFDVMQSIQFNDNLFSK